jgi:uncharacterized protein YbjT (DUF2867 family)
MPNSIPDTDNTNDTILVTGGTGKTGRRIVERLRALGRPVRVAARSTQPAFDWHDADTWDAALDGVAAVYLSYAPDLAIPGARQAIEGFVRRAVECGVQRLVLLSGRGEAEAEACERVVQMAGPAWTVVRAGWFNQNFSEGAFRDMVVDGVIPLPAGEIPEPFVDADDIADVAVAALTGTGHDGRVYEVTGPRLLTFAEVAAMLSQATGREVRFVPITQAEFSAGLAASGAPASLAWLLNYLFETVLDGRNAHLGDGVQRALGRPPADFTDYARAVAARGDWHRGDRDAAA